MEPTTIIIRREPSPFPKVAPYVYRAYELMPDTYIIPNHIEPLYMGDMDMDKLVSDVKAQLSYKELEFILPKEGEVFKGFTLAELAEKMKEKGK